MIFQGQTETSNATPAEQERVEPEPPIIVDAEDNDDFESVHLNGSMGQHRVRIMIVMIMIFMALSMILD